MYRGTHAHFFFQCVDLVIFNKKSFLAKLSKGEGLCKFVLIGLAQSLFKHFSL